VARNWILLLDHYQHLQRYEGETFGPALVLRGARERLAPILMTATTTGLALLPVVVSGDLPGHEIEHPMAIVILGGLVAATAVGGVWRTEVRENPRLIAALQTHPETRYGHMIEVLDACEALSNIAGPGSFVPRPEERPVTKFERRGTSRGHGVWDLIYERLRP
jgi:hypothetical protein